MKTCPVCEAKAFDDAEVCYGCLHRFSEDEARLEPIVSADTCAVQVAAASAAEAPDLVPAAAAPPQASIAVPSVASGGWTMRVEFCCGCPLEGEGRVAALDPAPSAPAPVFAVTEDGFTVHVEYAVAGGRREDTARSSSPQRVRSHRVQAARSVLRRQRHAMGGFGSGGAVEI